MNKQLKLLSLAVMLAITLTACGESAEPPPVEVTLTALDIKWDTSNIEVLAGQTVTITVVNEGALDHNFNIAELGIDININAGATEEITFIAPQSGVLEFVCNVPGHLEAGMAGSITVSE
jgi:uncharacterized cupredoxin-like copper-binding protein